MECFGVRHTPVRQSPPRPPPFARPGVSWPSAVSAASLQRCEFLDADRRLSITEVQLAWIQQVVRASCEWHLLITAPLALHRLQFGFRRRGRCLPSQPPDLSDITLSLIGELIVTVIIIIIIIIISSLN